MKTRIWYPLVISSVLLLVLSTVLSASYAPTLSVSRVPREDWTYDALALMAARGLIPGKEARHFYGDWLYTRREMAGFVASAVKELAAAPDDFAIRRPLAASLVDEFRPDIDKLGLPQEEIDRAIRGVTASAMPALSLSVRASYTNDKKADGSRADLTIGRVSVIGSRGFTPFPYIFSMSDQGQEYRTDTSHFSKVQNSFSFGKIRSWDWKIGQEYLWWGPGYSGSMILSDNSPAFPFLQVGKDFSLGKHLGRLRADQLFGSFDDSGKKFYFIGRRLEKTLSDQWSVAASETAKMGDKPNPLVLVIPSVYLYQLLYVDEVDTEFNSFVSLETTYTSKKGSSAYLQFLVDDMTAPRMIWKKERRPRKVGWLAGLYHPVNESTSLRTEVILTDAQTYTATRINHPLLSYTQDGYYIGHPVGPNSLAIYARAEHKFSPKLDGVVEVMRRKGRDPEGPQPGKDSSYNAFLSYGIKPNAALWLRGQRLLGTSDDRMLLGASYTF